MSHEDLYVNGDLLRLRREARGWVIGDMATRACMSVKQIRQLEEGGVSAFYSVAVKATAAKKVAALLGLTAEEVLGQVAKVDETPVEDAPAVLETADAPSSLEAALDLPVVANTPTAEASEHLTPSEPESPEVAAASQETKSKTSLWVIVGLFLAALAVAAYMQPQEEPAVEPAPPLQVVPSEATDSASVAQPSASGVPSVADNGAASAAQKPSAPAVAVASAPVASAAVAARPASAAASVANPASAASKAP